jgi:hypothetical protein
MQFPDKFSALRKMATVFHLVRGFQTTITIASLVPTDVIRTYWDIAAAVSHCTMLPLTWSALLDAANRACEPATGDKPTVLLRRVQAFA